jgi:lipopolysaccharide transport system permease protein
MIKRFKEIFRRRELLINLAIQDLKVRYKNALIGFGWTLLSPLAMMLIFVLVFRLVFRIRIENYPVFLLSGLFPWVFFTGSVSEATTSIVTRANLVKKTYFPREVIPISVTLAKLINFLLSLIVLFIFILIYKIPLTVTTFWLPVIILIQLILAIGVSLIVSSLHVCYRDIRYLMEILLMLWFYATPIVYSLDMVREPLIKRHLFHLYNLNPMVGVISGYHKILLYGQRPDLASLGFSLFISLVILVIGFFTFRKYERIFADLV